MKNAFYLGIACAALAISGCGSSNNNGAAAPIPDLPPAPSPSPTSIPGLSLARQSVISGLDQPVFVTSPAGDPRLFIVERSGRVLVYSGTGTPQVFLDVTSRLRTAGEGGLYSLAFHPDYASNGLFYVNFAEESSRSLVVERFQVSSDPNVADPTPTRMFTLDHSQFDNHWGGNLEFSDQGQLYLATGDGGGANDPNGVAQNPANLAGKMLRFEVGPDGAVSAPQIWGLGFRNPWRFSIDGSTVWLGDVGQDRQEEINRVSLNDVGGNFGWAQIEGNLNTSDGSPADQTGFVAPLLVYGRTEGGSVTGGRVYRGAEIAPLRGTYFYGDFISGFVRSVGPDGTSRQWPALETELLSSFGHDSNGELYICSLAGSIYKVVTE